MAYEMKHSKGGFPFKTDLTKTPNPTTKAIKSKSTLDNSSDHDMGNLEDKMRDEGVFSIGGQEND